MERDAHLLSLPLHSFWIPSQGAPTPGSPNRAPAERDAPFLEPSFNYLSKFPVHEPPHLPGSPRGSYRQRHPFPQPSSMHPLITHFSLKVHSKVTPLHVHPTGLPQKEMLHLQSQWFICSFISVRVPS